MTALAGAATATGVVQSVDWIALTPPAVTALAALAVLVADLFLPEARKRLLGPLALTGLAGAGLSLLPLLGERRTTFCLTTDPSVCSYVADPFALAVQLLVLGGAFLAALLSLPAVREERLPAGEFWFLLLASAAGAALLPAARDLATLVIALEVASLPAFALVGLRRGDRRSSEAALTFFLSSVTATAVMLLGVSFVYAASGSLHLRHLAERLPEADPRLATLAAAGVVLTLVGFLFKTAAAPFHFWVPDAYAGAPVPVAAYLSVIGKVVGFTGIALVTLLGFPGHAHVWGPALAIVAAATMTVGNPGALRQRADRPRGAVRLLAWSSVGQAGYLLVPLAATAAAVEAGDVPAVSAALGSTLAYAMMYAVVNLGAFAVVAYVGRTGEASGGRLADYRGLYATSPAAALAFGFFLLCLAGLPPGVIGLFAKVVVFRAAVAAELGWLAVVMAVNVVLALYYYLRWTALHFRGPPRDVPVPAERPAAAHPAGDQASPSPARPLRGPLAATVALTAAAALALSGAPQLVLHFASGTLL